MGGKGWMDKRTRRRENCAPLLISLSNECVASKCQAFTPTSIVLHSPSSFSHAHAYLHSPHIRTSTSTPYIIRILHMQAQVGQAWTLCVVWFTVRRARFFLGSTLRPFRFFVLVARCGTYCNNSLPSFVIPNAFCTSLRSALPTSRYVWMTFIASQSI